MKGYMVEKEAIVENVPIVIEDSNLAKFSGGICLLAVGWTQFGADLEPGKYIDQDIKVKVPKGTQFVDVSLLAVKMAVGTRDAPSPSPIANIVTDITIAYNDGKLLIDDKGFCTINFKAALQDQSTIPDSGIWGGNFTMQVKCYGQ